MLCSELYFLDMYDHVYSVVWHCSGRVRKQTVPIVMLHTVTLFTTNSPLMQAMPVVLPNDILLFDAAWDQLTADQWKISEYTIPYSWYRYFSNQLPILSYLFNVEIIWYTTPGIVRHSFPKLERLDTFWQVCHTFTKSRIVWIWLISPLF